MRWAHLFRRRRRRTPAGVSQWRESWAAAIAAPGAAVLADLEARLRVQPPLAEDLEIEEEMLEALRHVVALTNDLSAGRLPEVETTHRLVGADVCHFSAPVSIPDDPAQPTGRLLLTSTRAVFAGGGRLPALPWHAVRDAIQHGRDVLIVRVTDDEGVRFRCNSFSDAVCGAAIARHLARKTVDRKRYTVDSRR
jgi:hypothetical protein